jgi:transcriptional regulator
MSSSKDSDRIPLLQGTLDLLVLRIVALGPQHGHGIARTIQMGSNDALLVDHGSLYPALQRLENQGWIRAEWGVSDNNRRARFYEITARGRKQLAREASDWRKLVSAVSLILGPELSEG